ncbi:MAG: hypothetical protein ACTSYR_00790 [Candidatus Odinarchaeia archaeon]
MSLGVSLRKLGGERRKTLGIMEENINLVCLAERAGRPRHGTGRSYACGD